MNEEVNKKELKETRIKRYFIDSAKNLIKSEGIKSVSARAVAEYAGYSFSTLYVYFKNINELISVCVDEFIKEIKEYIFYPNSDNLMGLDKIKESYQKMIRYFIQYPGIYQLLFLENSSIFIHQFNIGERLTNLIDDEIIDDWRLAFNEYSESEIITIRKNLFFSISGLMLLYFNRAEPKEYREFILYYNNIINKCLDSYADKSGR